MMKDNILNNFFNFQQHCCLNIVITKDKIVEHNKRSDMANCEHIVANVFHSKKS